MQVPPGDGGHGGRVELDEGDVRLQARDLDPDDVAVDAEQVEQRLAGGDGGRDVADDQNSGGESQEAQMNSALIRGVTVEIVS